MRIVFCGTPEHAVPFAEVASRVGKLVGVVTAPDRPRGRGRKLAATPVKLWARQRGCCCLSPHTCRDKEFLAELRGLRPDVMVVVAYGQILPDEMLAVPRLAVNVHFSLLPQLRGAAPLARALQWGFKTTGVSVQEIVSEVDAGAVLAERRVPVRATDTAATLSRRLEEAGCHLLEQVLGDFAQGRLGAGRRQREEAVTYAPKVTAEDRKMDVTRPATLTARQVAALSPRPGAYCIVEGKRIRILAAEGLWRRETPGAAGRVEKAVGRGAVLEWGGQELLVAIAQREGGRPVQGKTICGGRVLEPGQKVADTQA